MKVCVLKIRLMLIVQCFLMSKVCILTDRYGHTQRGGGEFSKLAVVNSEESLVFQMGSIYTEFQNPDPPPSLWVRPC